MKKVTFYQAKDGSTHANAKLCQEHDQKLLLAPAVAAFVSTLNESTVGVLEDDRRNNVIYVGEELTKFIVANSDALRKVLTEPLIIRRPRKAKAAVKAAAKAASAPVADFA